MSVRTVLVLVVLLSLVGWWFSPLSPRVPKAPAHAPAVAAGSTHVASTTAVASCPLPPRVARGEPPLQSDAPSDFASLRLEKATMRALAGFSIEARVLGREDYSHGREADFSPVDLALGWGRMNDAAVVSQLDISQSSRWYRYRWKNAPPIPVEEIVRSSANMHMIPADDAVAAALHRIERGERIRIDGWLVEVSADDGWRWRSSLTRDDSGGGACELVYVCSITQL